MLDVIPVVEEQPVVDPAVVARRAVRVLVMPVNLTKREADHPSREISEEKRSRNGHRERDPHPEHECGFNDDLDGVPL
jgi:hypothetical protein